MSPRRTIEAEREVYAPVAKLDNVGDEVQGEFLGTRKEKIDGDDIHVHDFQGNPADPYTDDDGKFSLWGKVDLSRKIDKVKKGEYVFIKYDHDDGRVHIFTVEVED